MAEDDDELLDVRTAAAFARRSPETIRRWSGRASYPHGGGNGGCSSGAGMSLPLLLLDEVANALLTGIRRGRWTGAEADAAYRRLRRLPARIVQDERDRDRAWELRAAMTITRSPTCSTSPSPSGSGRF